MTSRRDTRSVELEIEVPGTPEQVWDAIATGPGISVWFVPSEVEEREGGTIAMHHGAGFDETGTVTAWDRPRRFAVDFPPFRPSEEASERTLALELLVEARSGDTCIVRLVNSGFDTDAAWDEQFEGTRIGWERCLRVLRLYLERFPGQRGAPVRTFGATTGPKDRAVAAFDAALGLDAPAPGERVRLSIPGAPAFAGTVDHAAEGTLTMILDEPVSGIGEVAAGGPGDPVYVTLSAALFGAEAALVAARAEEAWQAWMDERFPFEAPTTAK
jgi:uncharacterized protein YndB with AHSA1/START domain